MKVLRRLLTPEQKAYRRRRVVHALKQGTPGTVIAQALAMDKKTVARIAREEGLALAKPGTRYIGVAVP